VRKLPVGQAVRLQKLKLGVEARQGRRGCHLDLAPTLNTRPPPSQTQLGR
jgi:hypothetical protein